MREKRPANRAPIRSSQRLKRRKTVEDAAANLLCSIPSSQGRHKRPNTDAPDQLQSEPRFKRPRRTVDETPPDLLRPCYSLRHQAAKRRRPSGGGSLPPLIDWRDWANLGDGPAGLIAERVLANDVADYVRFRAACQPWRRCSADPRTHSVLDRRFHPTRWIVTLRETLSTPHRRRFLNVSTGQCVQVDIPELRDHRVLRSTSEGLLVLHHEVTDIIRLVNPLTRQVADLPPATSLGDEFICNSPDSAGLADDRTPSCSISAGSPH